MKCLTLILSLLGILCSCAAQAAEEQSMSPYVVLSGSESGVTKNEFLRVTSSEQWEAVWKRHRTGISDPLDQLGADQIPAVDFQRCMVTVIFVGSTVNMEGIEAVLAIEQEKQIVLGLDFLDYQTAGDYDKVTPFAFLIMPRSSKPIQIQLDVRGLRERAEKQPPKWEDIARIAAEKPQQK